jgi:phosphopantothenoylcysteine decarboxylase/phosphopantothenate--cysteine ligase
VLLGYIHQVLGRGGPLAGRRVIVTAGGTQEPIDPVRFVGNRSSGKMGIALAESARDRGAAVTLIHGPLAVPTPVGVECIPAPTAAAMQVAVLDALAEADALVMAAAVADYRPTQAAEQKIKKQGAALAIDLEPTPNILAEVAARRSNFPRLLAVIGFAAETEDLLANAREKLARKRLDLIVANDVSQAESGFGADTNRVTLLDASGTVESLPLLPKTEVAEIVMDRVVRLLAGTKEGVVK